MQERKYMVSVHGRSYPGVVDLVDSPVVREKRENAARHPPVLLCSQSKTKEEKVYCVYWRKVQTRGIIGLDFELAFDCTEPMVIS